MGVFPVCSAHVKAYTCSLSITLMSMLLLTDLMMLLRMGTSMG